MKPPKQTIVFRKDLNCRKGKIAAQVGHASMKVFFDRMKKSDSGYICNFTEEMEEWKNGAFTKIVLGCDSIEDIYDLQKKADSLNIPNAVIVDNGTTEFGGVPTVTCIAIGPCQADVVENLTSKFPLL